MTEFLELIQPFFGKAMLPASNSPSSPRHLRKMKAGKGKEMINLDCHQTNKKGSLGSPIVYLLIFLCAALFLALLGLFVYHHPEEIQTPVISSAWVETSTEAAPSGVPIMGYWADDVPPQIFCVVKVGTNYYEFTANPSVPGMLLRSYDPDWWVSLPGGTK